MLGDCLAGSEVTAFVAVYDPAAGFVTVGGWIMYPAGAYTANPDLTGKATFGFVAKYKKGANVPDGNTEFQNKAGDLNAPMRWASGQVSVSSSPVRDRSAHWQPLAAARRPISAKSSTPTLVSQYSGGTTTLWMAMLCGL